MKTLIVDDQPDILMLVSSFLEGLDGVVVTTAESGRKALEIIESASQPFECFLLDVQMPGMSGVHLCRMLRAMPEYRHTPILMLTAMSDQHHVDAAFAAGASDYVNKPFSFTELSHSIRLAQNASQEAKALAAQAVAHTRAPPSEEVSYSLDDAIPITDVVGVIQLHAFQGYLKQMGRLQFHRRRVLIVAITNIVKIYNRCRGREFSDQIADMAEAISIAATGTATPLIAYFGNGRFGISVDSEHLGDLGELHIAIQDALYRIQPTFKNGDFVAFEFELTAVKKPTFFRESKAISFVDNLMYDLTHSDPAGLRPSKFN